MLLSGMSVALAWVMDQGGKTLQRLIDDEPIANLTKEESEKRYADTFGRIEALRKSYSN